MKQIALLLSFISIVTYSYAQQKTITGKVIDANSKLPIENCVISSKENKTISSTTDAFGVFTLQNDKNIVRNISVTHIGYEQIEINTTEISQNLIIELKQSVLVLQSVTAKVNTNNSYNSISNIDLKLKPINSSQEILRSVPGLFIAQHAGGGKAEQIFLRGFDIDHGTDINITVDGMPVNMISHAHGQGYADLHFLNPETIERVNFDKGPHEVEKGNLSTAGYVDFKTKDFLNDNSFKIEGGSFGTGRVSGMLKLLSNNTKNKREQLYVASEFVHSDGYFESNQNFNRFNIMAKYSLNKNSKTKFSLLASTFTSKWNASGQIPERAIADKTITRFGAIDDTEGGNTTRTNVAASLSYKLKSRWELSQNAFFTNYQFNLYSNFTFFKNNPVEGDMINQNEKRNIYGYTAKIKNETFVANKRLVSSAGLGFRYDNIGDISLSNAPNRKITDYIQKGKIKELNSFGFLHTSLYLNKIFNINAGVRVDNFRFGYKNEVLGDDNFKYIQQTVASPKLTIHANISDKVSLFASNGIGFHSNDSRVIIADSIKNILPKVYGNDFGVAIKPAKNLYVKTIFWHLFSEQEFVYVGDEGVVEPSGKSRRLGIDILARYQVNRWLFADADFSYAKPRAIEEPKGSQYIPLAPTFTSIGGLSAKIDKKWSASLRYRYLADRAANSDYSLTAKGYFLMDFVANYSVKRFDFNLSVENVLNQKWKEAQFETTTRLQNEIDEVTEIHFTPGSPLFLKAGISIRF
jgi:outer membrane cobalamin receptor